MRKPVYFSLQELLRSEKALKYRIDNTPSWEVIEHLYELALFLDELREAYGKPIRVTSGYRCPQLNNAVGGSNSSVHQLGYAADLQATDMNGFIEFIKSWAPGRHYDQIILESSKTSRWVHIGIRNSRGEQRHKLFSMSV